MPKVHRALRPKRPSFFCQYDLSAEKRVEPPAWKLNMPEWYLLARDLLRDEEFAEEYLGHFIHKELSKGGLLHEII